MPTTHSTKTARSAGGRGTIDVQHLAGIRISERHISLAIVTDLPDLRIGTVVGIQLHVAVVGSRAARDIHHLARLQRGLHHVRAVGQVSAVLTGKLIEVFPHSGSLADRPLLGVGAVRRIRLQFHRIGCIGVGNINGLTRLTVQ